MDASGHMAAAAKAVAAAETAADVDALLAVAPAGAVGAEIPDSILHIGVERKAGDVVVLRAGLAERKGSSGLLQAGQPAVMTRVWSQTDIKLERRADGADLGDRFGKADLVTAAPAGGWLLHLAAFLGRPAAVVGVVLAADASAAGAADVSGWLPVELAVVGGGCSEEAWELLWGATPEDLRLRWVATYLGEMWTWVIRGRWCMPWCRPRSGSARRRRSRCIRTLLDGQRFELVTKHLPAVAKAVAAAETAADVEALLAAAAAGAVGAVLPEFGVAQFGKERKEGDAVVLRAGRS